MTRPQSRHAASEHDSRRKQLIVGLAILGLMILTVPAFYVVWRWVPGLWGEWLGVIAGVMSTPFLLEGFFIIIGLIIVVTINHVRHDHDGEDFVYLEQVEDSSAAENLPDHSKFAVYRNRPLEGISPSRVDEIEGALEMGDHAQAAEWLAELSEEELHAPEVLSLRLRLARETGKPDLADVIEREIQSRNS